MIFKYSTYWLSAFTFILLLLAKLSALGQNDTTWYNDSGHITTREQAVSYGLKPIKTDSGYQVEELYLTGGKKMEGFASSADGSMLEGWATWYNENGDIRTKVFYEKGARKKYISFWEGEEFATAEYRNNQPYEGKILAHAPLRNGYLMPTYQKGYLHSLQIFESDPNGIRYGYTLTVDNDGDTLRQYEFYNAKGELLGKYECVDEEYEMDGEEEDKLKKNGTFVDYYFDPMQVGAFIRYKNGKVLSRKDYYRTGELREEVIVEGETATAKYYKPDGTLLGEFSGHYNFVYDRFKYGGTGTKVHFYSDSESKSSPVKRIVKLKDGKDVEYRAFTTTGTLQQLIKYSENGGRVEQHFNEKGKLIHELIWKNHAPYHGIYILSNGNHEIYENGEVTEKINFYKSGEKFSHKKDNIETYYNKEGKIIGKASFESLDSKKPIEGKVMQLINNKLRYEKHYKDGKEVKRVEYYHSKEPLRISKKETFYEEGGGKSREKWYYSTGDLRSDILYDGYRIKEETFYDKSGKVIGKLLNSDGKETGTEVKFFYESDLIQKVITYDKEGEIQSEKKYEMRYDENQIPYTILEAEIQANGKSKYYGPDGNLLGEAEFRDGKPFSGITVKHPSNNSDYELYITKPYKEGEVHGIVKENIYYDKEPYQAEVIRETAYENGQRNGSDKIYYPNGELRTLRHYKNGKLHGKYISYDENGNIKEQNSYDEGKPYDGYFEESFPYSREIENCEYKIDKGDLVYCDLKLDGRLLEKTTMVEGKYKTVIYKKNGEDSTTIILDEDRNGSIIHQNKGDEPKNIIKEGEPWSGIFYFTNFHKYETEEFGEADYLEITLLPNSWKLIAYDVDSKEIFQLAEQKHWKDSDAISRYLWVGNYLTDLSQFYKYKWSTIN